MFSHTNYPTAASLSISMNRKTETAAQGYDSHIASKHGGMEHCSLYSTCTVQTRMHNEVMGLKWAWATIAYNH